MKLLRTLIYRYEQVTFKHSYTRPNIILEGEKRVNHIIDIALKNSSLVLDFGK